MVGWLLLFALTQMAWFLAAVAWVMDPDTGAWPVWVYFTPIFWLTAWGALVVRRRRRIRRRVQRMEAWARANHLDWLDPSSKQVAAIMAGSPIATSVRPRAAIGIKSGQERHVLLYLDHDPVEILGLAVMSAGPFGAVGGLLIAAFIGSDTVQHLVHASSAGIPLGSVEVLPRLRQDDKRPHEVRLDSTIFEARHMVISEDRRFAFDVMAPRVMEWVSQHPALWEWHVRGGWVWVKAPLEEAPQTWWQVVKAGHGFEGRLARHLKVPI